MYSEKIKPILEDLENKNIDLAGGSTVGMVLSITNSLISYICNLTLGKKKYEDVQEEVIRIKKEAEHLKEEALLSIDKDKEILEEILDSYKLKKEKPEEYEKACKKSVDFCYKVTENAVKTLELSKAISKVGNKMLSSDFKICKIYSKAAIEASIVNIRINLDSLKEKEYIQEIENKIKKWQELE